MNQPIRVFPLFYNPANERIFCFVKITFITITIAELYLSSTMRNTIIKLPLVLGFVTLRERSFSVEFAFVEIPYVAILIALLVSPSEFTLLSKFKYTQESIFCSPSG
jgi:hypothetical protein